MLLAPAPSIKQFGAPRTMNATQAANYGILAIPVGCLAALAVLPASLSEPGALMFSSWLLAIGLLTGMIADVLLNGIHRIFRAEHIGMMAVIVVIFAEPLQSFYVTDQATEVVQKTFIAVAVFGTAFALGSSLWPGKLPKSLIALASRSYSSLTMLKMALACWTIAMVGYFAASGYSITVMIEGLGAGRWGSPWARGSLGDWTAFRDFLSYFGYPLPTFAVFIRLREKSWFDLKVVAALFCAATFLPFPAQGGGRRVIVVILGSALVTWLCAHRINLKVRHYAALAAISLLSVIGLEIMLAQRNEGLQTITYKKDDFTGLHVDNNFDTLSSTLQIFPEDADYLYHKYIWYTIVRPIPRILWEGKPVSGGFDLAAYRGWRGVSLANTIVGELYMSFGWIAIVLGGILLGRLASTWSQLLDGNFATSGLALYGMGTMCLFIGIRSMLELVLMTYPIFCWWGLDAAVFSRAAVRK